MYDDELMHYGILGMKWGVRRTPEELGHIRAEKGRKQLAKYKSKQEAKVEKAYNKAAKKIAKSMDYDPENEVKFKEQLQSAKDLRDKSMEEIAKLTYSDMKAAQKAARDAGLKTAKEIAITTLKVAPVAATISGGIIASGLLDKGGMAKIEVSKLSPEYRRELQYKRLKLQTEFDEMNLGEMYYNSSIFEGSPFDLMDKKIKQDIADYYEKYWNAHWYDSKYS